MIDITTAYILKTWGVFMSVLFPVGEALVLLIDWIFQKWDERNETNYTKSGDGVDRNHDGCRKIIA